MDQTASSTWAKLAVISACAIVPLFGAGCEDAQSRADRKVRQAVHAAELASYEESGADKAAELLQTATQMQDAGDASKADAYVRSAQADYARALSKLPALAEREAKVSQAMDVISQLGLRLAANNQLINIYKGNDPAGAAQGDPLKALQTSKARCVALVSDLNKKMAETKKQIDAKAGEIATLESNRSKAVADADALLAQSEQAKGQASLDVYKKALDARSAVASLGYNIGHAKAAFARLQQTLVEQQQQAKIAQEGIAAVDKQLAGLNKASADARKAIQSRVSVGKGIATQGTDLVPGGKSREPGIEAKAKELAAALAAADEKRKEVDGDLDKAIKAYEEAASAANKAWAVYDTKLRDEVPSGSPARPAIQKLKQLYSPLSYNMDRSRALQARGRVYASYATLLGAKQSLIQSLTPAFKQAGFQLPAELNPQGLPKQIQDARKIAEQCFDDASKILEDAMERGEPAEKAAAQFPRIGAQYALYTLTGQEKYLTASRALLKEAAAAGGNEENAQSGPAKVLPTLPLELEQGIIKRATVSASRTTQSATQPSTAPAGEAGEAAPASDTGQQTGSIRGLMRRAGQAFSLPGGQAAPAAAPADNNAAPADDNAPAPADNAAAPAENANAAAAENAAPADDAKPADGTKSVDGPTRRDALQRAIRPLRPGAR